ncbi:uncharacterized protein K441DRAFT_670309 [Cenococcum geophilum 1.58]|uniref:Uncharacterized protein n=1 Tax=Cenococcum geophilum 1.58 TaxID=794803 RepID=A0ACC8EN02_9PEZI|nr:hypothetical protein K441DRAFT_670309 [Cenococcum geophilum 1.58]
MWRIGFVVRLPCTACSVAVHGSSVAVYGSFGCIGIYIGGKGGTPFKAVL